MADPALPPDFSEFLRLLNAHRVSYLIVGGYAVGFHGHPRATADIDIWVPRRADTAQQLVADLDRDRQRLIEWQGTFGQAIRERLALEVLHDEKVGEVLPADVIERADVRVGQLRDRARFTLEPLAKLRISCEGFGEDLHRDDTIEPRVAGLVDFTHAAGPEGGENLVRAEASAGL